MLSRYSQTYKVLSAISAKWGHLIYKEIITTGA